jgi:hypothetical protein
MIRLNHTLDIRLKVGQKEICLVSSPSLLLQF